jgi:hypothetical protein
MSVCVGKKHDVCTYVYTYSSRCDAFGQRCLHVWVYVCIWVFECVGVCMYAYLRMAGAGDLVFVVGVGPFVRSIFTCVYVCVYVI